MRRRARFVIGAFSSVALAYACVGEDPEITTAAPDADAVAPSPADAAEEPTDIRSSIAKRHIAIGTTHACALTSQGDLHCWGSGHVGQLGVAPGQLTAACGGFACAPKPTKVPNVARSVRFSVGDSFTCAIDEAGAVWCFGVNDYGQLGFTAGADDCAFDGGILPCSATPKKVISPSPDAPLPELVTVSAGGGFVLALSRTGAVFAWGRNDFGQCGRQPLAVGIVAPGAAASPLQANVVQVSAGYWRLAVGLQRGKALTWGGDDLERALGRDPAPGACDGGPPPQSNFRRCDETAAALPIDDIAEVRAAYNMGLARTKSGQLWAWGRSAFGTFMRTKRLDYFEDPTQIRDSGVEAVDFWSRTGCYVAAGTVYCWGGNSSGQIGSGAVDSDDCDDNDAAAPCVATPRGVSLPGKVIELSVGSGSVLVLLENGSVYAWGDNTYGQLGHVPGDDGDITLANGSKVHPSPILVRDLPSLL